MITFAPTTGEAFIQLVTIPFSVAGFCVKPEVAMKKIIRTRNFLR
jgi:hypothetical protein